MGVTVMFITLSMSGAVSVNYYKLVKDELAKYVGNVLNISFLSFIIVLVIVTLLRGILFEKIGFSYSWLIIATSMSFMSFITVLNLTLWLVEQKPKNYSLFQIGETIIKLGLSLYFVILLAMSWQGRIYGMFIGTIISALVSLYFIYRRGYLTLNVNKEYIKDALGFGIPLIPHQLSFWFKSGAIVFLLSYFVGNKETGLYNVGLMLVLPLGVLTNAFNKAFSPYLYRKLSSKPLMSEKLNIVKFTYSYFVGVNLLAFALILVAPFVIDIFLDVKFADSYIYVVYLAFGAAFQGMYLMVVNYIFYIKQTKYLTYITFVSSVVNVALAYFLINKNGTVGAAQASLVASMLTFLGVWYYSNKVYSMPWFKL